MAHGRPMARASPSRPEALLRRVIEREVACYAVPRPVLDAVGTRVRNAAELRAELLRESDLDKRDRVLRRLLASAQAHEDAALVLLFCLLPGLAALARRFTSWLDPDDVWDELLTGLLARIRTFDLHRRPRRIAANLLLDTLASTCRWARGEASAKQADSVGLHLARPDPATDFAPLDEALDRGVLRELDAALIGATRLGGMSLADVAVLLGLGYEAAKKRRRRAELAFANWWSPTISSDGIPVLNRPAA